MTGEENNGHSARTLEALIARMMQAGRSAADVEVVRKAWEYAESAHAGQIRESGEPYFDHPAAVAFILAEMDLDPNTIAAGLLHDVVEDTGKTYEEMAALFGPEVAALVDGVTKLSRVDFKTREEQQAESLRKMLVAMARDIRVILIKLADRLHNMRTLRHSNPEKQVRVASETVEIYAPLAHRLGMWRMKWELEDLALRYLEPAAYYELVERVATKRQEREERIEEARQTLHAALQEIGIEAEIQGRPKHFYSIYRKMVRQGKDFGEIWDLMGMRVIVDTVRECYAVLGAIHSLWKPIPGRFKDYIAMPKSNMYQSLHTTVVGPRGEPLEIQIRTWDMHRTAEYGIAAHWRYKEKIKTPSEFEEKLTWLRQLLEWQHDYRDPREFIESLKIDLFTHEVFVFTPRGDVIDLPAGSIPLDFAYRIHTDIGHQCVGCRVNGRLVPLSYKLQTGDIVEIITSKQGSPSRDWLKMVKTSQAKNKIRAWFKKERREENIEKGRELLERELRRNNLDPPSFLKDEYLEEVGRKFHLLSAEDLYAAVGYGGVSASQVVTRLQDEFGQEEEARELVPEEAVKPARAQPEAARGVSIQGVDNLLIRMARCCSPVPGDEIIGFITRGRGVSIHRRDCPNLSHVPGDRFLEASWEAVQESFYPVEVEVTAHDRTNLLAEVVASISEHKVNITAVNGRSDKSGVATIHLTIGVKDRSQLEQIMNKLRRIRDVYSVNRYISGK